MPVDNDIYDQIGDTWWDDANPLSLLRTALNPGRFGYFRSVLVEHLRVDPCGKRALDVGCGGGFLAEEFARLGCRVVGVDPSAASIKTARAHAISSGLDVEYRLGTGESLPCDDASFDIVCCCDVLEHVSNRERVIAEIARVLAPGGVFFYDTINRTVWSKLVAIKLMQEWHATRIFETNLHDWTMFITPPELVAALVRHGLANRAIVGLTPRENPLATLRALWQMKRGVITYGELGRRLPFAPGGSTGISYMGYAIKSVAP